MSPFTYPSQPHERRHGPLGYAQALSFRPWLRDEFAFRCVYCLIREQWGRLRGTFDLDHFLPVSQYPEQANTYDNLLYACAACNAAKGNRSVPDPTSVLLSPGVWIAENGRVSSDSSEGSRLIELLGLDSPQFTEYRMLWIGIIALAERYDRPLYLKLQGFPNDLPDLSRLRPPQGNNRIEGIQASFFVQRANAHLPETY
jgi:hypothetical protein